MEKVISLINKMRLLQGFSLLDPKDAAVMAASWLTEFKRNHVPAELYEDLMQKAFDYRVRLVDDGTTPPAFDLTLLLSTFNSYYTVEFQRVCDECRDVYGAFTVVDEHGHEYAKPCKHENYLEPPRIRRR